AARGAGGDVAEGGDQAGRVGDAVGADQVATEVAPQVRARHASPLPAQPPAVRALHEARVEQLVEVVALGRLVAGREDRQGVLEHRGSGVGEGGDDLFGVVAG